MRRWGIFMMTTLLIAGCWNPFGSSGGGGGGGGDGQEINRKTMDNLVDFLAFAYERREIDKYEEALDDRYLFEFTPDVAIDSLGLPPDAPWWGKAQDVHSTENMFESPEVTNITMDLSNKRIDWAPTVEIRQTPSGPDSINAFVAQFEPIIMVTIEKPGREPKTLEVRDSWLDIWVTQDPDYEGLWVILRIKEIEKP